MPWLLLSVISVMIARSKVFVKASTIDDLLYSASDGGGGCLNEKDGLVGMSPKVVEAEALFNGSVAFFAVIRGGTK